MNGGEKTMETGVPTPSPVGSTPQRIVAVVEVGTSSIRLAISEVDADGGLKPVEALSQGVSLGKDTFTRGEIDRVTIEECVRVLRSYRKKLGEYNLTRPEDVRVVATSAVREATNRMAFVDRIYVATGFVVEPIDVAEVHRITYRSIRPLLRREAELRTAHLIIAEVGGGSTEVLRVDRGHVAYSHSYRLGSLRLRQSFRSLRASSARIRDVMEQEIHRTLDDFIETLPPQEHLALMALGGDVRFATRILQPEWDGQSIAKVPFAQFAEFTEKVLSLGEDAIVRQYRLPLSEAETLGPGLLIYRDLAEMLKLDHIQVTSANLRDGMLSEMVDATIWTPDFREQIVRSALELARKYEVDKPHARAVADLARKLFVALQAEHGLDARHELILYLAALLHEVGGFVSTSSIHKHSMYIILNSELFGLSRNDALLASLVARYHRRASPKPTHQGFSTLSRDGRVAVSKMAAILRIAIALDASRTQRITDLTVHRDRRRLTIEIPGVEDLSIEQLALKQGRLLFEEVFGLQVLLRTTTSPST